MFFKPKANIVDIIPIKNADICAALNCSLSVDVPCLIKWVDIACENAVVEDITSPDTPATAVVNATAEINANKKSPPNALANKGAAKLPVESALTNVAYPITAVVPKPNTSVIK